MPKHHIRIEAYGMVDELNSWIGLIRDQQIDKKYKDVLVEVQDRLFTMGSSLASDPKKSKAIIPSLKEEDITFMEQQIDAMDEGLPEMRSFILPGGHTIVSYCHVARCVCRRAERVTMALAQEEKVEELLIAYLNRLSDYLFVLARKLGSDLGAEEIPWNPRTEE